MRYSQNGAAAPKKSSDTKSTQHHPGKKQKLQTKPPASSQPKRQQSLLSEQVQKQAKLNHQSSPRKSQNYRNPPEVLDVNQQTELEDLESPSMSFSQQLQHRASLADDDPQLAQMYWYNLGHHQSDMEALLSCER